MNKHCVTVFYDGSCESCVRDRFRFEQWLGKRSGQIEWFDITDKDDELWDIDIDPALALRELHVRDCNGVVYRELDAYIILLRLVWWLKPVIWFLQFPPLKRWVSQWYRQHVDQRLAREGRG
ncbi:hypothetical protein C942_01547 [Photobacterium marinum]|uniref:Cell division inhibitor n=1 Tax=Photobacterium marinum TaxID=1056511 RepID=L8JJK9_9GAMM|nr:DCC1-like thiol-disulfide oxidoreductase family protein [Photobacterium marinum]ELR67617.1 hypothetical protein C942_01547 [Photobacterium marinum]